jgi:hypothetical protein
MVFKCSDYFTYKCGAQGSAKELLNLRLPDAETHASIYFSSHGLRNEFSPKVTFPRFCPDSTEVIYVTFR